MPINENSNGKREFDPAKRIRDAVGEEAANNMNAEAIERLVMAAKATSSAVRTTSEPVIAPESGDTMKNDLLSKIVHTNPIAGTNEPVGLGTRTDAITASRIIANEMCAKRSVKDTIIPKLTGFDKSQTKAVNISNAVNMVARTATGFGTNLFVESACKSGSIKDAAVGTAIGTAIDVVGSAFFASNKDIVDSVFNPNFITQAEATSISKAIRGEKIKYAAEHAIAGVILPVVAKTVIGKVIPNQLKHNEVLNVATSFGALSTVGKTALTITRTVGTSKLAEKVSQAEINVKAGEPIDLYTDIAKLVTRKSIDRVLDQTMVGSITGSVVAGVSTKQPMDFVKSIAGSTPVTAPAVVAKPVVAAKATPTVEVKKAVKTEVKPTAKKTA